MELKLNLKQLTDKQLKQISGGKMVDGYAGVCRCTYAPPPNSEFRNDTRKYDPPIDL